MDNAVTRAQRILNELARLSRQADNAQSARDYREYDEAKATLGDDALYILPELINFVRLVTALAALPCSVSDESSHHDLDFGMIDLLTELRRFAYRHGVDFDRVTAQSKQRFDGESTNS